jgi:hypothetical protein
LFRRGQSPRLRSRARLEHQVLAHAVPPVGTIPSGTCRLWGRIVRRPRAPGSALFRTSSAHTPQRQF